MHEQEEATGAEPRAGDCARAEHVAEDPLVARPAAGAAPEAALDWPRALKVVGGDRELLQHIAGLAVGECSTLLARVTAAVEEDDPVKLQRAAHTWKSSFRLFGASRCAELAFRLETLGESGTCAGGGALVDALCAQLDAVLAELRAFEA